MVQETQWRAQLGSSGGKNKPLTMTLAHDLGQAIVNSVDAVECRTKPTLTVLPKAYTNSVADHLHII